MGEGFLALFFPLAAVVVEERFWGFNWCIPFIKGVRGSFLREIWKIYNAGKVIYHIFEAYYLYFYFSLISLFFSATLSNFHVILYILSPHYSLISNFFAYYSLISIKKGHYSLISKPHPDPHDPIVWYGQIYMSMSENFVPSKNIKQQQHK